jgi:hypothetical protein
MFNFNQERKKFEKFVDADSCKQHGIDVDVAKKVVGNLPLLIAMAGNKYDSLQDLLADDSGKTIVDEYLKLVGVDVVEETA